MPAVLGSAVVRRVEVWLGAEGRQGPKPTNRLGLLIQPHPTHALSSSYRETCLRS